MAWPQAERIVCSGVAFWDSAEAEDGVFPTRIQLKPYIGPRCKKAHIGVHSYLRRKNRGKEEGLGPLLPVVTEEGRKGTGQLLKPQRRISKNLGNF